MASKNVKLEFPPNCGLYVITDIEMAKPRSYYEIVQDALLGGARVIQIRDKKNKFEDMLEICKKLKIVCDEFEALLIINDNPYLAQAADAHGLHIGQMDISVEIAREIIGKNKILGLSTHTKTQAIEASYMPVDYIGIGPIFQTSTKQSEYMPLSPDICRWIKKNLSVPFVAIGGINMNNIKDVIQAGAENAAVISAIMGSENIQQSVREFIETMKKLKEVHKQ